MRFESLSPSFAHIVYNTHPFAFSHKGDGGGTIHKVLNLYSLEILCPLRGMHILPQRCVRVGHCEILSSIEKQSKLTDLPPNLQGIIFHHKLS